MGDPQLMRKGCEGAREPLERTLNGKRFSPGFKKKMKDLLYAAGWEWGELRSVGSPHRAVSGILESEGGFPVIWTDAPDVPVLIPSRIQ